MDEESYESKKGQSFKTTCDSTPRHMKLYDIEENPLESENSSLNLD